MQCIHSFGRSFAFHFQSLILIFDHNSFITRSENGTQSKIICFRIVSNFSSFASIVSARSISIFDLTKMKRNEHFEMNETFCLHVIDMRSAINFVCEVWIIAVTFQLIDDNFQLNLTIYFYIFEIRKRKGKTIYSKSISWFYLSSSARIENGHKLMCFKIKCLAMKQMESNRKGDYWHRKKKRRQKNVKRIDVILK